MKIYPLQTYNDKYQKNTVSTKFGAFHKKLSQNFIRKMAFEDLKYLSDIKSMTKDSKVITFEIVESSDHYAEFRFTNEVIEGLHSLYYYGDDKISYIVDKLLSRGEHNRGIFTPLNISYEDLQREVKEIGKVKSGSYYEIAYLILQLMNRNFKAAEDVKNEREILIADIEN